MNFCQSRSDVELAWASAHGDLHAFEQLYKRHHRWVYSTSLRILNHVAGAEEVTREVFTLLYLTAPTSHQDSSFAHWLHRLTINAILRHLRNQTAWAETAQGEPLNREELSSTAAKPQPIGRVAPIERVDLERAIAQLPLSFRLALVLHDVGGLDDEEITTTLGISPGSFRSQLNNARLQVRRLLSKRAGESTTQGSSCKRAGL
jgi:RNA polymerase sigma-70 factor (ECF subfamily)